MNYKRQQDFNVKPLVIILTCIVLVFFFSRLLAYLVIVDGILPHELFLSIGDYRLHHFVYGNILITVTSFFAIGLGIKKHKDFFAAAYGIGLGMVLDEFVLWMGDPTQLGSETLWIPHSSFVIGFVSLILVTMIFLRLHKIRRIHYSGKKLH